MERLRLVLRHMLSIWRFAPGVAAIAVIALAMGIGFTTTMFGIVHGATRPLPFAAPHEIVAAEKVARGVRADTTTRAFDYRSWSGQSRSFAGLGAFESVAFNLGGDDRDAERVTGVAVTASAFSMLPARAFLGRVLQPDDMRPGAPPVVVISQQLWLRRFGGDPGVVGGILRLSGQPHTIVGVMPSGFGFPVRAAIWTPLAIEGAGWREGEGPALQVFGRLQPGATVESASAELQSLTRGATLVGVRVTPFTEIETPRDVIRALYLMVVAVSFVLLIACSNVAGLLLARSAARAREVAVRLALGASRRQLVIAQLVESLSLAAIAAVIGLGLAHAGMRVFAAQTSHIIEAFWVDFRVDATVVLFASALAAIGAVAAGLGPALKASGRDVADTLKDRPAHMSSLGGGRLNRRLIAVQVALACGLLALTMILGRASVALRSAPWPYDPGRVLTFETHFPHMPPDDAVRDRRLSGLIDAISRVPGVQAAGLTSMLPGLGGSWTFTLDEPRRGDDPLLMTSLAMVSPGFFDVVRSRALSGRQLTRQDEGSAPPAAVVNQSFVRRFSPDRDPIGRRIFLGTRAVTIVGVVPDLMAADVQDRRQDGVYLSIFQQRPFAVRVMARGLSEPLDLVPSIRAAVHALDPDLPLTEIFTLHEAVYREKRVLDVLSSLFLVFGIGALSLTAIGLYGVVTFAVAERTREIGIRLALGATRTQIFRLVTAQGGVPTAIGLVAGLILAAALSRGFAAAVEQIPPADAPLLGAIVSALALTVAVATFVPARRAALLEIVRALRHE